jgi:Fe-S-cluster-containing dehydrogenase component
LKAFVIDITKCNGCYNCQIACKDEHVGNDWTPIAKPQPDTGQFWMKVKDVVRGQVPKVKVAYMHYMCQHCAEAPCIAACKSNAIYQRPDGAVIIDPTKCSGQKLCLDACPYGVIYYNNDLQMAQKCTWCAHLLDNGWEEPRCVDACPTGALKFGDEEDLKDLIADAEVLLPEAKAQPRVYYVGIPKRFVAGAVYDPEEDECLEDATVTLRDADGKEVASAKTDVYGDFWFEGLKVGTYSVKVEKSGYLPREITGISTEKDVNIGDLELSKKI